MPILVNAGLILISAISILVGIVFIKVPKETINLQIAIYRFVNWKMEPISWEKEIRNTRIMGVIALICGILSSVILFK